MSSTVPRKKSRPTRSQTRSSRRTVAGDQRGNRTSSSGSEANLHSQEKPSQFTLKMRKSLHRELARMALDADMTMRGFIMSALKSKGLSVTKADLVDRRRR